MRLSVMSAKARFLEIIEMSDYAVLSAFMGKNVNIYLQFPL